MRKPYFHWKRLVRKYSRPFTLLVQREGSYQGGLYQNGLTDEWTEHGAIIAMKRSSMHEDGGNHAAEDKHLYMLHPIPHALETVQVYFQGQLYRVTVDRDHGNEDFTGVYAYYLTWVQKFDHPEQPPPEQGGVGIACP